MREVIFKFVGRNSDFDFNACPFTSFTDDFVLRDSREDLVVLETT